MKQYITEMILDVSVEEPIVPPEPDREGEMKLRAFSFPTWSSPPSARERGEMIDRSLPGALLLPLAPGSFPLPLELLKLDH